MPSIHTQLLVLFKSHFSEKNSNLCFYDNRYYQLIFFLKSDEEARKNCMIS